MDNKSELSKPVAQIYYDEHDSSVMLIDWLRSDEPKNPEPLYSQEYVSALRADAAKWFEAFQKAVSIGARYEERIAELEDAEQKLCAANVTLDARASAAEAKLATPVRLPNKNDDEFWFDNVFQVAKFDRAVERAISAAGFKFVGDEQ